jgi:histidinol-phosphate phosphatase family protein
LKQAIILAGGKGTRLRERLGNLPKPLIDICGIPLLERQILLLKNYNFDEIIILVNYQSEKIIEFCESNNNWGLSIKCINDGDPLGTAGAVLKIFELLSDEFLVVYGDTMLEIDINRFYRFHNSDSDAMATLLLHPNDHPHDSDIVEINEKGEIIRFYNYPHDNNIYLPNLVNAALYWIKKDGIRKWKNNENSIDFAKDLFPMMLSENLCLKGYNCVEYIKDCGTPERLDKVCDDYKRGRIEKKSLNYKQKAVFIDRDGTINEEVGHLNSVSQFSLLPNVELSIKLLNKSDYISCVITNQPVVARGECSLYELKQIHNKLETLLGNFGSYIDRIYFCPHHPNSGFDGEIKDLKKECTCRKPNIGMIEEACNEMNISLEESWFIGDSTTDILTAKKAGVKSILVETGYGGLDYVYSVVPDFILPNLENAVNFILNVYPSYINFTALYSENIKPGDFVFIGGLSRSGKSTFASVFKQSLKLKGKNAHVISIDRWLKSENDRTDSVNGRYDIEKIEFFLKSVFLNRNKKQLLSIPNYNRLKKERTDFGEAICYNPGDILIIEGTIALNLDSSNIYTSNRFFVVIDEKNRKDRVLREYLMRGYSLSKATSIYFDRQKDETPIVLSSNSNCILINTSIFY